MNEEKCARQKADLNSQEKERQISMLSVDYRQIQQRLQKLEGEHRQEIEKVKALHSQIEEEQQKKNNLQLEKGQILNEIAQLKAKETQMSNEIAQLQESKKLIEEEMKKMKRDWSIDKLQMKEIQDNYETEHYFSTLYKTQTVELKEELEEKCRMIKEFEDERSSLKHQCQLALARADSEALARSIAEETVADLEKEKTMKELELKDITTRHKNDLNSKDIVLNQIKEKENELKKINDQLIKENDELNKKFNQLQEELNNKKANAEEIDKLYQKIKTEQLLKQQAVNKLHEIMNRRDWKEGKTKSKASSADLRRKEKDLKKLQQEFTQERMKNNQCIADLLVRLEDITVNQSLLIILFYII